MKLKVLSLFSGIGAFEKALDNLEIAYKLVGFCDNDKFAPKSYSAIHDVPESMNLGDITKVDEKALPKDIDLITYGFPCQDISLAGKQKGLLQCEVCNTANGIPENFVKRMKDGEKFYCEKCGAELKQTRSGLFFEALRIIEETKPKVAIAENVKNLTGKKFKEQFQIVLDSLEEAGYNNYWKVLNLKNFGIPQNRERVFIVSIRKDVDTGFFQFPEGFPLELRLKDMLEDEVDEKFFLSEKAIAGFIRRKECNEAKGNGFGWHPTDGSGVAKTIQTSGGLRQDNNFIEVFDLYNSKQIDPDICGTITTGCSRNGSGTFLIREATKKGYAEAVEVDSINFEQPNSKTRRGRVGHGVAQTLTTSPQQGVVVAEEPKVKQIGNLMPSKTRDNPNQGRLYDKEGLCPTLGAMQGGNRQPFIVEDKGTDENKITAGTSTKRIRKLTPKECFRLMGFTDLDFLSAKTGSRTLAEELLKKFPNHNGIRIMTEAERISKMSNTQLYKQAGNSIGVPVIEYIIKALIDCKAFEPSIKIECEVDSFKESIKAVNEEVQELAEVIELNDTENTAVKKKKVGIFASLIKAIARAKTDRPEEKRKHKII